MAFADFQKLQQPQQAPGAPNAPAPVTPATPATPAAIQGGQEPPSGGTWTDWMSEVNNEAMMSSIPALRMRAEQARRQMNPLSTMSADFVGSALSPSMVLNAVPFVGGELAGGVHEGLKAYNQQPDWWPTPENRARILEAAGLGAAAGAVGHGIAAAPPAMLQEGIKSGIGTGVGAIAHMLPMDVPGKEIAGWFGGYKLADKAAEWAANSQLMKLLAGRAALGGESAVANRAGLTGEQP